MIPSDAVKRSTRLSLLAQDPLLQIGPVSGSYLRRSEGRTTSSRRGVPRGCDLRALNKSSIFGFNIAFPAFGDNLGSTGGMWGSGDKEMTGCSHTSLTGGHRIAAAAVAC